MLNIHQDYQKRTQFLSNIEKKTVHSNIFYWNNLIKRSKIYLLGIDLYFFSSLIPKFNKTNYNESIFCGITTSVSYQISSFYFGLQSKRKKKSNSQFSTPTYAIWMNLFHSFLSFEFLYSFVLCWNAAAFN